MRLLMITAGLACAIGFPRADTFYCQAGQFGSLIRAYTAMNEELADDIPDAYIGEAVGEVTLWVSEWGAGWIDPDAIRIRFYYSECAPDLTHDLEFTIPWSEVDPVVEPTLPWGGYEINAPLPAPVTITAGMSIGVSVVNSWGPQAPWAGFYTTPSVTDCELQVDQAQTARWTPVSDLYGAADLAYCLTGVPTSVPAAPAEMQTAWGAVKKIFR